MKKTTLAVAMLATLGFSTTVFAADSSNQNGDMSNPKSSAAAMPKGKKHSAGTVGAMKGAEGGSFTASKADQKKAHLH